MSKQFLTIAGPALLLLRIHVWGMSRLLVSYSKATRWLQFSVQARLRGKKNLINKYYEKSHTMPVLAYAYYISLFWPNKSGTSY